MKEHSIVPASEEDRQQILDLYEEQKGKEFCPWAEDYPSNETIDFDLAREALFVMKDGGKVIAAISIDDDEAVNNLECWNRALYPGGELSRVAVTPSMQNKVIDTMLVVKERDGGLVGKLIGINPSNVTLNIVFCVIFLLFLFLLVEVGHSYYICNHIDKDLVKVIIPAITLSLGYIFGRGCT